MTVRILIGDCRDRLRDMPDASVHCVVTSPPYFNLRDYGHEGQIGLEETPDAYVDRLVDVFREVRRVLRDDGTLWLNLGDSYARSPAKGGSGPGGKNREWYGDNYGQARGAEIPAGLKQKDLIGIPWRVAFALQADGWVLRQDVIWSKGNPMPESVRDRCTKSHEMVFMFAKARWVGSMPPRHMKPDDARWLALLLETEGNIAIRRYTHKRKTPQHALQISIANSDISILEEARRIAGRGSILTANGRNRPVYYLQWTTKVAADLLWEMYPFLFGKKRQAAIGLMLEARRSNKNKGVRNDIFDQEGRHFYLKPEEIELREKMWLAVKALNRHEPVDLSWLVEPKEGRWVSQPYYFDQEAIKEPAAGGNSKGEGRRLAEQAIARTGGVISGGTEKSTLGTSAAETRNRRSVWTISTKPFKGAHFATFPPELAEICIKAGTKPGDMVLDPFGGAGTTGLVADQLGRDCTLIELNPEYAEMARKRLRENLARVQSDLPDAAPADGLPLFALEADGHGAAVRRGCRP